MFFNFSRFRVFQLHQCWWQNSWNHPNCHQFSSKLTWNIVDGDKWALFQLVLDKRPDWKCKHRNKLVQTNFWWMVNCFQFFSTHMIRLYWIGYIPVFRQVPVVPLEKLLNRQNMIQFHRQDWNQCPWFDDLKNWVKKMFSTASFFLKLKFLPKKFICIGW